MEGCLMRSKHPTIDNKAVKAEAMRKIKEAYDLAKATGKIKTRPASA